MNTKRSLGLATMLILTPAVAFAQAPAGGGPPAMAPMIAQMVPILGLIAIMYFLFVRPQQQRQNELNKLQTALAKGDRVLTQAGIYGTVVGVDGDKVVVRVDDTVKLEFQKSAIVGKVDK
jgi:preprotein translocase subunit YajC